MSADQKKVLEEATKALLVIDKASLTEIKAFIAPPKSVSVVFTALAEVFGQKNDWKSVQKFISRPDLINTLVHFKLETINAKTIKALNPHVKGQHMSIEEVTKASKAAASIWKWILAVYTYGVATLGADFTQEIDNKAKTQAKTKFVWRIEPEKEDPEAVHEEIGSIVKSIKKEQIREMTLLIRPSNKILKVMEGVCVAINDPRTEWGQIKRLFSQTTSFRNKLLTLSIKNLTKPTIIKLKSYVVHPDLDINNLEKYGPTVQGFQSFNQTVVKLWEDDNGVIDPDDVPKLKIDPEPEFKKFASTNNILGSTTTSPKPRNKSKPFGSPKSRIGSNSPHYENNDADGDVFNKLAALQDISEADVLEFKKFHLSQKIIEGVHLMLQGRQDEWGVVYKFLSNPDKFIHCIRHFEIKDVPKDNIYKLKEIMRDPRIDRSLLCELSHTMKLSIEWLDSIVNYKGFSGTQEQEKPIKLRPALKYTNSNHITELRSLTNPTNKIKKVLEAVCILLGEKPDWNTAKKLMSNPIKFLDMCNKLRIEDIPVVNIQKVKKYMNDPDTDPAKLSLFSMHTADMAKWFRAVVHFWEDLYIYNKNDTRIEPNDPMLTTEADLLNHMDDKFSTGEKENREESKVGSPRGDLQIIENSNEEGTLREDSNRLDRSHQLDKSKNLDKSPINPKDESKDAPLEKSEQNEFPNVEDEEYKALLLTKIAALDAAIESVRGRVDQVGIEQVLDFKVIPQGVEKVFEMAAIMLNEERSWDGVRDMLNKDYMNRIANIKLEGVERQKIQDVSELLKLPEVNKENMVDVSIVANETLKWARAYVDAWKFLHRDHF